MLALAMAKATVSFIAKSEWAWFFTQVSRSKIVSTTKDIIIKTKLYKKDRITLRNKTKSK
jgi:hypothetical protein